MNWKSPTPNNSQTSKYLCKSGSIDATPCVGAKRVDPQLLTANV